MGAISIFPGQVTQVMHFVSPLIGFFAISLLTSFLIKNIADGAGRATALLYQYTIVAAFALSASALSGTFTFSLGLLPAVLLGLFNGVACYLNWKASAISLSKTGAMGAYRDMCAIFLAAVFLGEWRELNFWVVAALVVSLMGSKLLTQPRFPLSSPNASHTGLKLTIYVLGSSILWGITTTGCKYYSSVGISGFTYLSWYYVGSLCASGLIYTFSSSTERSPLSRKRLVSTASLSLLIYFSSHCLYLIYTALPLVVAQPIVLLMSVAAPVIAGMWVFREHRGLSSSQWYGLVTSSAGVLILIVALVV